MVIKGWWEDGRPYVQALVRLPNGYQAFIDFLLDTAASHTLICEHSFPKGMLMQCGLQSVPIGTLVGPMPGYLVPKVTVSLFDVDGSPHPIEGISPFFIRDIQLGWMNHFIFKRALGREFPRIIQAARSLIGRDILNRFFLLARPESMLTLTDQPGVVKAIEAAPETSDQAEQGWQEANQRRLSLVHQQVFSHLSPEEAEELDQLQREADQRLAASDASLLADLEECERALQHRAS